ncbi:hypothetical protein [Flavobacterium sp. 140616W15]|uniref:hypothetical protein n=1 Tax=Flavobacterium sp. 140616W15 TaxID=2478552 RepID=UPI000F0C3669|nr:hypothetical protein [Flavobacterium sp. 140616W15]AYN04963.1 hypothetical protein EAG11_12935 [Flavobacterium sp. 140616W15]
MDKKWKDPKNGIEAKNKVRAFLIPKINLEMVLAQGIDAARAYIGINDEGVQTLMLVGTRLNKDTLIYEDMLPKPGDSKPGNSKDGNETAIPPAIYDFSQPCPPQGDPSSPLN